MTNPRHMPQFGTWSVPNCPLAIEYDLEVLEAIRREVTTGFQAPRGGVEVGGLLLGTYDGKVVRITGFGPVRCDHASGPKFVLNEDETQALDAQLLAHEGQALAVVGWYQSHLRRGLTLSSEDVRIYDRHFPKPWQVALLLRPDPAGGIHARFFLREPGTPKQLPSNGVHRVKRPDGVRERASASPVESASYSSDAQATSSTPDTDAKRGIQNKAVWAVLAAMFVLAVVSVFYMRFNFAVASRALGQLHLEAVSRNGNLELRWDPKELGEVSRGRLEVHDGPATQQIVLDRSALNSGRYIYHQKSDVIGFRLQADRVSGGPMEGSAMYIARNDDSAGAVPAPPVVAPVELPVPVTIPPPAIQTSPPPPVPPAAKTEPLKTRTEESKPSAPVVTPPVVSRAAEQPKPSTQEPAKTAVPKQDEPTRNKPDQAPPTITAPVQTAQVQRQTSPEPPPQAPPSVRSEPVAVAAAPRVIPKETPATTTASTPTSAQWRLGGRWVLQSGGFSRSPAVPESVSISLTETDGTVQGTLEARYKSRSKAERVHFLFSGKMVNGASRFSWTSTSGRRAQIEFIRVPNSPDVAEVVWQNPDNNHVFDEMLRRAN